MAARGKAFAASLSGTSLEYYDFAVYGTASALVFPQLFFPGSDPLTGLLLAFTTFAVGYVSRPIGGVVFGRPGRKPGGDRGPGAPLPRLRPAQGGSGSPP